MGENFDTRMGQASIQYLRHLVQFVTFAAINAKFFGFMGTTFIAPYVYPSQAPYATVARAFCGWACPMGLLQDILIYIPNKKDQNWGGVTSWIKPVKWGLVTFSIVLAVLSGWRCHETDLPLGFFSEAPFQVLSPSGTLFAYLPWMALWKSNVLIEAGLWGWLKLVLLIAVLVPSVYIPRFFCRYVCPMGAVLTPLAPYKFLRIKRSTSSTASENNKVLNEVCPMSCSVTDKDTFVVDEGCIHCGN